MRLGVQSFEQDIKRIRASLGALPPPFTGSLSHGDLLNLAADDHAQYVHVAAGRTIAAQHTFAPPAPGAPFTLGATAQGQLVAGLNADLLDGLHESSFARSARQLIAGAGLTGGGNLTADRTFHVGAGAGITVNADDVALTTPGTLSVESVNNAAGSHTHAITAASNPGAATALLKSDAAGQLQLMALGIRTAPAYPLHVQGPVPQLRLQVDAAHYADISADASDNLHLEALNNIRLAPAGDVLFDPAGREVYPATGYAVSLGLLNRKWSALHAAELYVETLVAHDTMATIGGRIVVAPTTTLVEDIDDGQTTITVRHDQIASGDHLWLEAGGQVEFMEATSGPGGSGPYTYSVTRGTTPHAWPAGTAVVNTGSSGSGFIDLYALSGLGGYGAGPTIAGNVRTGPGPADWEEYWAIGNLNGNYGYGADTFGAGFGPYGGNHLVVDETNGIRFRSGTAVLGQLTGSAWTLGQPGEARVQITNTQVSLYDGAASPQARVVLDSAGLVTVGRSNDARITISDTGGLSFYDAGNVLRGNVGSTALWFGKTAATERLAWDGTNGLRIFNAANAAVIQLPASGNARVVGTLDVSSPGVVTAGDTYCILDNRGLVLDLKGHSGTRQDAYGQTMVAVNFASAGAIWGSLAGWDRSLPGQPVLIAERILTLRTGDTYVQVTDDFGDDSGSRVYLRAPLTVVSGILEAMNDVRAAGGIVAGNSSVNPATGDVVYTGYITKRDSGGVNRPGRIYVPLVTGVEVYGNTSKAGSGTETRTRAQLGVPNDAIAVVIRLAISSSTQGATIFALPSGGDYFRGQVARAVVANTVCDGGGIVTVGSNLVFAWSHTCNIWAYVSGYFI
jgi:hypothetical protein